MDRSVFRSGDSVYFNMRNVRTCDNKQSLRGTIYGSAQHVLVCNVPHPVAVNTYKVSPGAANLLVSTNMYQAKSVCVSVSANAYAKYDIGDTYIISDPDTELGTPMSELVSIITEADVYIMYKEKSLACNIVDKYRTYQVKGQCHIDSDTEETYSLREDQLVYIA